MKIAFLVNKFPVISETFILNQVTGLLDRGHQVEVIARGRGADNVQHKAVHKYDLQSRVHYRPSIPDEVVTRLAKLARLYLANAQQHPDRFEKFLRLAWRNRHNKPIGQLYHGWLLLNQSYDVIHCQYGYIGDTVAMLREIGLLSTPVVTTFHGYDINAYPRKRGRDCYHRLFRYGSQFTVGSKFAKKRLLGLGAPPERVHVWPMGISPGRFRFRERRRSEGHPVRLLTVARLVEEKGLKYAIEAVSELLGRGYRVRYRIVGEGEKRPEIEALVQRLGLEGVVDLSGAMTQDQVREQYDWAHIFAMPGVTASSGAVETQGIVLAEAQASGLPVVATSAGGIPESICDERSGFLVPERDVKALADRIAFLIDHSERWGEMGRAGRAYVKDNYDIDELIDNLISLYRQIL